MYIGIPAKSGSHIDVSADNRANYEVGDVEQRQLLLKNRVRHCIAFPFRKE